MMNTKIKKLLNIKNINILFFVGYFLLVITDSCKKIPIVSTYQRKITAIGYLLIGIFIILNIIIKNKSEIKAKIGIKKIIFFMFLILISCISYIFSKNFTIIRLLLLITASIFLDFDDFLKKDIIFKIIIVIALIIFPFLGIMDFNYLLRADHSVRYSFGFEHPNSFSMYLIFIILESIYITKTKKCKKTYYLILLSIPFIIAFMYFVCNSRVYAFSLIIFYAIILFYELINKIRINKIVINKGIYFLLKNEYLIFTMLTLLSIVIFNTNEDIGKYLDKIFSQRYTNYNVYINSVGFSLLGKETPYVINYSYLDNMFLDVLINFGIVQAFYYYIIYYLNNLKAKNKGLLILIFLITCVIGFTDTNVIIPTINVFLLYFSFNVLVTENKKEEKLKMKYIICEGELEDKNRFNASNKPRKDVEKILTNNGYERLYINSKNGVQEETLKKPLQFITYINNRKKWCDKLNKLNNGDVVLFQYPLLNTTWNFYNILEKYNKKLIFIALVHDMDSLRWTKEIASDRVLERRKKEDKYILNNCNYIISHNYRMREELVKLGNKENNILELQLFDYLMDDEIKDIKRKKEEPIIIAGNLSKNKAKYLLELKNIKNTSFNLYGVGYEKDIEEKNVFYKGKYNPEELVNHLEGSFGLVWDGESKDTCIGGFGNYLRYNNPHKASMYLTAGIPIITWREAAIAKFVQENKVGVVVDGLDEISNTIKNLTEKEYNDMIDNSKKMSKKLKKGYFLTNILENEINEKINN